MVESGLYYALHVPFCVFETLWVPLIGPVFPCSLALFLVFVAAVLVLSLATGNIQIHSSERQFLPIYLLNKNEMPHRYSSGLLVQNSSGESRRCSKG